MTPATKAPPRPARLRRDRPPRAARRDLRSSAATAWADASDAAATLATRLESTAWGRPLVRAARVVLALLHPVVAWARTVVATISPLGWVVVVAVVLLTVVGWRWGWQEFRIAGVAGALLLALAALFTIGRTRLAVTLEVEPRRVVVGESTAARVAVTNAARTPLLPVGLEVPVGLASARFTLPALAPGGTFEDLVVIPTTARGVVPVGPARTQRGDPFGLVRREVAWTPVHELFVHPRTVPLESLGAGLLRDLEGQSTNDISMSDLDFHTLREYVPGDDRRYIHWRSSAKASGTSGQGEFLVRQFLDTRRSHLAVVLDVREDSYPAASDFELAVAAGASIAGRALVDQMDLTILCGEHSATDPAPHTALDTFARAGFGESSLPLSTSRLATMAPDVSTVVVVTGPETDFTVLQRCRAHLAPEVRMVAIRVAAGAPLGLRQASGITVLFLGSLEELPRLLAGGVTV